MANKNNDKEVKIEELIAAEQELSDLKRTYGLVDDKPDLFTKIMGLFHNREDVKVKRKTYLWLMLFTGIIGGHRFYAKQYLPGVFYLLTCWCGVSLAMTIIDLLVVIPKEVDENGMILFEGR